MQDDLLSTAEVFYDCIDDGFDHQRALAALSKATDNTGICLTELKLPGRIKLLGSVNIPDEAVSVMTGTVWDSESHGVFKHYASVPEGVPVLRRSIQSDSDYFGSSMYKRASAPWGLHSEGCSILKKGLLSAIIYGFVRHPGQDEVGHEILSQMAFLNVHFLRAMRLRQRMNKLEEALIQANNVLDLIQFGLALYTGTETPSFVNASAHRIFGMRDGIELKRGGLMIHDRTAHQQFQGLLNAANSANIPFAARAGGIVRVPRPSRKRPFSLMIVPMPGESMHGLEKVGAAVFLFDPGAKKHTAVELFEVSYGLTPSESVLAHELAQGVSLDAFATKRGISRNTVKSHLHSIFAKTETSRQPELVSLLLRSVAGIGLK